MDKVDCFLSIFFQHEFTNHESGVVKDQRTKSIGKLADVIRNLAMKNDSLLDLVCFKHYFDDKLQQGSQ